MGYFDTSLGDKGLWIAEEGKFEVLIGASSANIRYVYPWLMMTYIWMGADNDLQSER